MSTDITTARQPAPAQVYRTRVETMATQMLEQLLGSERGRQASARVGLAFAAAARTAKRPEDLYQCDPSSVASCVAMSALSGLMPGGVNAECWLVPRRGELTWMASHRGLIRLAREAGYNVRAIPVHVKDTPFRLEMGDVVEHGSDPDQWPTSLDDLRGVYVTVQELATGTIIGRPWLPIAAIRERQKKTQTGPVWGQWPVEMAMKTAIKWACARGYVPLTGVEVQTVMEADTRSEVGTVEQVASTSRITRAAGALPDYGDPTDPVDSSQEPPTDTRGAADGVIGGEE